MDWIFIFLAVVCPFVGFAVHGMKDADHQFTPTFRDRVYGFGTWLGGVGLLTLVVALVIWFWSISTKTEATIVNLSFLFLHALLCTGIGGIIMGASRTRNR